MAGYWGSDYWSAEYFEGDYFGGSEASSAEFANAALVVVGSGTFTGAAAVNSISLAVGGSRPRKRRKSLSWPQYSVPRKTVYTDAALVAGGGAGVSASASMAISAHMAVTASPESTWTAEAVEHDYTDELLTWLMAA